MGAKSTPQESRRLPDIILWSTLEDRGFTVARSEEEAAKKPGATLLFDRAQR